MVCIKELKRAVIPNWGMDVVGRKESKERILSDK